MRPISTGMSARPSSIGRIPALASAVHRATRPAEVSIPFARLAYRAWRILFAPRVEAPPRAPQEEMARGRYWADHVSICTDCHTPRDRLGVLDSALYLAGVEKGPDGKSVPNISPHATGIGDWDESDVVQVSDRHDSRTSTTCRA